MDNKIIYGGVTLFLMLLSTGTTIYLQETGKNIACKTGWVLQDDGQYKCQLSASVKLSYCTEVWDSANTKNYWCKEATLVVIEEQQIKSSAKQEVCTPQGCIAKEE
jgi:hypothetical protein